MKQNDDYIKTLKGIIKILKKLSMWIIASMILKLEY